MNDFDEHRHHQLVNRLARHIERFGYRVSLQPATADSSLFSASSSPNLSSYRVFT